MERLSIEVRRVAHERRLPKEELECIELPTRLSDDD